MPIHQGIFVAYVNAESGAGTVAALETDKSKTDTPTQSFVALAPPFKKGIIKEISYRIVPTAGETYTFMVFEAAAAGNMESNSRMLYESAALRTSGADYKVPCEIPFNLATAKTFPYATDWTGAPGNSYGYLKISGVYYL